jgi:phosphatidylglycerophosphatase A
MNRLALFVATCAYIGYVPVAPGTFGSAAGLLLLWAVRAVGDARIEVVGILLVLAVGVWASTATERQTGRVDPGIIVVDEVAGMLITMAFIPATVISAIAAFLIFRVLDIVKPWPARQLERLPHGLGVMADDAMAAVYGNLIMHALMRFASGWFR